MDKDVEAAQEIRGLFGSVAKHLDDIWAVMSETSLSNIALGAEVAFRIGQAKVTYEALHDLPDSVIFDDRGILDILAAMEEMVEAGGNLLMEVDDHRRRIEATYG
jgi:hypothetical protein